MAVLDFAQLDVNVVHSLGSFTEIIDKMGNMANIRSYFQYIDINPLGPNPDPLVNPNNVIEISFNNTQLDCELHLIDTIKTSGDDFTFVVYNMPAKTVFYKGDYLIFTIYWLQEKDKKIVYHGIMDDIKTERVNGDLKTTVKGKVVHEFVLDRWTIYNKYPLITKWYQIPDFIKNDLGLQFYSTMSGWDTDIKIYEPIYTKGKSVSRILDEICKQVTKYVTEPSKTPGKITRWKLINNNTIIIYRDVDLTNNLLNNQYKITAPSIHYTDLFEYTENSDNYQIQTIGIPTLKAGIVFQINTTGVPDFVTEQSAYFVAQEVEHTITCKDGYLMKIHAKKAAQESK